MPSLQRARFAGGVRPFPGVGAQRLEQPVAGPLGQFVGHHQRLVDQLPQQAQDLRGGDALSGADRFRRLERPAAGEDGQPTEDPLLLRLPGLLLFPARSRPGQEPAECRQQKRIVNSG